MARLGRSPARNAVILLAVLLMGCGERTRPAVHFRSLETPSGLAWIALAELTSKEFGRVRVFVGGLREELHGERPGIHFDGDASFSLALDERMIPLEPGAFYLSRTESLIPLGGPLPESVNDLAAIQVLIAEGGLSSVRR